jgi:selenocysteine-specific elongation factor
MLVRPGELEPGRLIDVRVQLQASANKPLRRRSRLLVHAGTAHCLATVTLLDGTTLEPGQSALAQLQLDEPMVMLPGDRFILRGFVMQRHYGTTVGGGIVLRTLGARLRRGTPELLERLRDNQQALAAGDVDRRVLYEVERAGERGLVRRELLMRVPFGPRALDTALARLRAARALVRYDQEHDACIARPALTSLTTATVDAVTAFHAAQPLAPGMPREELRTKVTEDARLLHVVLESLRSDGRLVVERDVVRLPTHDAQRGRAAQGLQPLAERAIGLYRDAGLGPPRAIEAAAALKAEPKELERVIDLLVRGGSLVRIQDLLFERAAVEQLRARLLAHLQAHAQITPQEWKELVGQSRKFSIPLAEYFDAEKLTLRVGEVRKLRGLPSRPP